MRLLVAVLFGLGALSLTTDLDAACFDVADDHVGVSGRLEHKSFAAGETVEENSLQQPDESAYLIELAAPMCFSGDEYLGGEVTIPKYI
jgi:hypothetical protein